MPRGSATHPLLHYASEAAYPFYGLHQTVLVAVGWIVVHWPLGAGKALPRQDTYPRLYFNGESFLKWNSFLDKRERCWNVLLARRVRPALVSVLVLVLQGLAVASPMAAPAIHELVLDNGVRVVLYPLVTEPPIATFVLGIAAGYVDTPPGQPEVAWWAAEVPLKRLGWDELLSRLEDMDGWADVRNSLEFTRYRLTVPLDRARQAMALAAALVAAQNPVGELGEADRAGLLEAWARRHSEATSFAWDVGGVLLFPAHPYNWRSEPSVERVQAITGDDVAAFVERYHVPEKMLVLAVGDIDPDAFFQWAQDTFGPLPPRTAPGRTYGPPAALDERVEFHAYRELPLSVVELAWQAPPLAHTDRPAMAVLAALLGDSPTSRLRERLREDLGPTSEGTALYEPAVGVHAGRFDVIALVEPGKEDLAERVILEEIDRIRRGDLDEEELEHARRLARDARVQTMRQSERAAENLSTGFLLTGDGRQELELADRLATVTAEEVAAAVRRWLLPNRYVRVTVGPADSAEASAAGGPGGPPESENGSVAWP